MGEELGLDGQACKLPLSDRFAEIGDLIEELHSRLAAEGIAINYPVRKPQLPDGLTAVPALQRCRVSRLGLPCRQ